MQIRSEEFHERLPVSIMSVWIRFQTRKLFLVSTHLLFTTYIIRNQQSVTFIITYEDDF